ncbi:glycerophosphodiester phosphodiesterase [Synoicihabitans lomoniglobus]|uniref:glycerophosphodiester phosphodiesterase n=1 Tax=Synoicihabitans lomoniglobus TaxID=2909285 RepID=UPI002ED080D6|nr:glycerophosphodiester phosphodiesterase [Opitutaceae bacterium LMO-M01]
MVEAKLLLAAHRGSSWDYPENTLAAFAAAKLVADYVEFDVRVTVDGQFVVMHDPTVDRTTNGTGTVAAMMAADITRLDAGARFHPRIGAQRVPTAEQTLREIQTDAAPMMECKSGTVAQMVALLDTVPWRPDGYVMHFNYRWLVELKQARPDVQVGWLGAGYLSDADLAAARRDGISLLSWRHSDLNADVIARLNGSGMIVWAWTVNDATRCAQLAADGIDGLVADDMAGLAYHPMFRSRAEAVDLTNAASLDGRQDRTVIMESGAESKLRRRVQWMRERDQAMVAQSGSLAVPLHTSGTGETYRADWVDGRGIARSRRFAVTPTEDEAGGLANLSARAAIGTGDRTAVVGWVTQGDGLQPYLVRGVGPTLAQFGVPNAAAAPWIQLFDDDHETDPRPSSAAIDSRWESLVAAHFGAFPLVTGAGDVVQLRSLRAGTHTAHLGARDATGTGLLEIYRSPRSADVSAEQLLNLSFRCWVPTGGNMVAGFVVDGPGSQRLLIRGLGPALRRFGIAEALPDPIIRVVDASGRVQAVGDDWSFDDDNGLVRAAMLATGSADLMTIGSRDAAILLNLAPGVYTVILESAVPNQSGIGLIELFALDEAS